MTMYTYGVAAGGIVCWLITLAWWFGSERIFVAILTMLLIGCGREPAAGQNVGTDTKTSTSTPAAEPTAPKPEVAQEAPKPVSPTPRAPTKEETFKMLTRLSFDTNFKKGNVFQVENLYYFIKGNHGTLYYPDVTYVPDAKDVSASCPVGFEIADMISLSIAQKKGMFDHLVPEVDWVWTSSKAAGDTVGYYAMVTKDLTDQWGFSFTQYLEYAKHRSRIDAQVYCMMNVQDLPRIEDLPADLQSVVKGLHD